MKFFGKIFIKHKFRITDVYINLFIFNWLCFIVDTTTVTIECRCCDLENIGLLLHPWNEFTYFNIDCRGGNVLCVHSTLWSTVNIIIIIIRMILWDTALCGPQIIFPRLSVLCAHFMDVCESSCGVIRTYFYYGSYL